MDQSEQIPPAPITQNQFQHVAQVLQVLMNVGAAFSHQRTKPTKTELTETPTLIQACFQYIGKNSHLLKNSNVSFPEEVSNDLLAFLIQKHLLTKDNLNLILSNEASVIRTLSLERYGNLKEEAIQQIAIATSLQGLSLRGCFCVSDSTIQLIAQGCASLTTLDISDLPRITSNSISYITLHCTLLKTLCAERCMNINGTIDWKNPSITNLRLGGTKVSSLNLSAPLEIVDVADCGFLSHTTPDHRTLQFINFFLCKSLNKESVTEFLYMVGPSLTKLNMFECEILEPKTFEHLSQCLTSLESLTLSNNSFLVDNDIKGISQNCTKLKNLFVNSCPNITSGGMSYVSQLSQLETISFPKVTDASVVEIVSRENKFKNIDICQNPSLRNDAPKAILKHCKQLFALSLAGCRFVTDESFSDLESNIEIETSLQNLNLENVPQLTDNSIRAIGRKFKNLSALDLYKNPNVTDEGLLCVLKSSGHSLKRLYLQFCVMISDETVGNICKLCPNLEYLDLYGVTRVTIEAVRKVFTSCTALKELNLETKLREEAIQLIQDENIITKTRIICSRTAEI